MSPSGSRYYCSTEQHNDSLSYLTWAGLREAGETSQSMWKSSCLFNQERSVLKEQICKEMTKIRYQIGTNAQSFSSSVWEWINSSVKMKSVHVRVWTHQLYCKINNTELNINTCPSSRAVAIVTLSKKLNHLILSSRFLSKVYLTDAHVFSRVLWPATV